MAAAASGVNRAHGDVVPPVEVVFLKRGQIEKVLQNHWAMWRNLLQDLHADAPPPNSIESQADAVANRRAQLGKLTNYVWAFQRSLADHEHLEWVRNLSRRAAVLRSKVDEMVI